MLSSSFLIRFGTKRKSPRRPRDRLIVGCLLSRLLAVRKMNESPVLSCIRLRVHTLLYSTPSRNPSFL